MNKVLHVLVLTIFFVSIIQTQDDTFPPQDSTPTQMPAALKVKKQKKLKKAVTVQKIAAFLQPLNSIY